MNITKTTSVIVASAFLLSACASAPESIRPTYHSRLLYEDLSCQQLVSETRRLSAKATEAARAQGYFHTQDIIVVGVGVVLFWPALFFVHGDRHTAAKISRLKGQMVALEAASQAKNCGFQVEKQ